MSFTPQGSQTPTLSCDQALKIAREDAEKVYRDLSGYDIRLALADGAQRIDAALVRHGDIEQQHVANLAACDIQGFAPGSRFRYHLELVDTSVRPSVGVGGGGSVRA